jgi:PilZ domain
MDCADDVTLTWVDKTGPRRQEALLLNISRSGARLNAPQRIPVGAKVELVYPNGTFPGKVTQCLARSPNHNLGVSFAPGHEWSRNAYWPKGAKGIAPVSGRA